jgi:hypothetical protein
MPEKLVFLHMSDIHFRHWSGDEWDVEDDLRNELLRDVQQVHLELGGVSGILVSGDIAFSGAPGEYEHAKAFLQDLCRRADVLDERVWCVPGNHDVDRNCIKHSPLLKSTHRQLRQTLPDSVDGQVSSHMRDIESSELLLRPVSEYNRFAAAFQCEISPTEPVWHKDLKLNDGSILRLNGLNSTIVSDESDDESKKVILGRFQIPQSGEGIAHVSLCHHPPDWWLDEDVAEQTLNARASIQLFGHKHRQRLQKIENTLRLSAGAMHPDRTEANWTPRFNWLCVQVLGSGRHRRLLVSVYPRVWSDDDAKFIPDTNTCAGQTHRDVELALESWKPPDSATLPVIALEEELTVAASDDITVSDSTGATMADPVRTLTYRFFSLAHVVRLEIAADLKLLRDEDEGLQDYELFTRVLKRAVEAQLLDRLWDEVEARHGKKETLNPFRKG